MDAANNVSNSETIYGISGGVKIAVELLDNPNYGEKTFTVSLLEKGSSESETLFTYSATTFGTNNVSVGDKGGLNWTSYDLTATITFAGETVSRTNTHYITGLPYSKDFRTDSSSDSWSFPGTTKYSDGEGYRLYYAYTDNNRSDAFSPIFYVPDSQNILADYNVNVYAGTTLHNDKTYNVYSGITTGETVVRSNSISVTENTYIGTSDYDDNILSVTEAVLTSSNNRISISHDANLSKYQGSEHYIFLASFNIKYSLQ